MKNILVTGVSRGMGEATARLLVNEGYFVYGVYNSNANEAQKIKEELKNIEMLQCDFSKRVETLRLTEKLKDIRFHGVVNSAGIFLPIDFEDFDIDLWDKSFEINLNAALLLVHSLKDNIDEGGSIVNIASTDGMIGAVSGIAYAATKAALINLTQTFANLFASRKIGSGSI